MPQTPRVTITHEHVNLLSVTCGLDWGGLLDLQQQIDLLLDAGARFLIADLSWVGPCDTRLFDLLARTSSLLRHRAGWLRLIGPRSTLDGAALPAAAAGGTPDRVDQLVRPS